MGMDLSPIDPTTGYPSLRPMTAEERLSVQSQTGVTQPEQYFVVESMSINWSGWHEVKSCLAAWGVDISEFSTTNDFDEISAATCVKVAGAIQAHLCEFQGTERGWWQDQIPFWRYSGGFVQW